LFLSNAFYMYCFPPWFNHLYNIWRGVQFIDFISVQISVSSCYFSPLGSYIFLLILFSDTVVLCFFSVMWEI
jgi:hypothetical protein